MRSRDLRSSLSGIVLVVLGALTVAAEPSISKTNASVLDPGQRCKETLIHFTAGLPDERRLACRAALQALQSLSRCHAVLRRPLHVQIGDVPRHPLGRPVIGFFDATHERIVVAGYRRMPSLVKGTPFEALSQEELFKSIVVHEVVHGVLHQNRGPHAIGHVAGEYLAYAFQLEALPSHERDSYWRSIDRKVDATGLFFADLLLQADPFLFAALAYEHFKAVTDRCAHARALLRGEGPFIVTWY